MTSKAWGDKAPPSSVLQAAAAATEKPETAEGWSVAGNTSNRNNRSSLRKNTNNAGSSNSNNNNNIRRPFNGSRNESSGGRNESSGSRFGGNNSSSMNRPSNSRGGFGDRTTSNRSDGGRYQSDGGRYQSDGQNNRTHGGNRGSIKGPPFRQGGGSGSAPTNNPNSVNQNKSNNNSNNNNNAGNSNSQNAGNKPAGKGKGNNKGGKRKPEAKPLEDIFLLDSTGTGENEEEKKVVRRSLADFLSCRLEYLDPPMENWNPHKQCDWTTDRNRRQIIEEEMGRLWHYKPLQVDDGTRWKSRAMKGDTTNDQVDTLEPEEERLRKAIAILNKLSWTTLDKLNVKFVSTLQGGDSNVELSKQLVRSSMSLIVDKAMEEPYFAELYARFSAKLALEIHKMFKKQLIKICEEQFEATSEEPELPDDPAERKIALTRVRRRSIGLMQFLGELYNEKLIKGNIMIFCIERLCVPDDEESLECFAKLMTTIGQRLDEHKEDPVMHKIWDMVYSMAGKSKDKDGPNAPSVRIKFLLQDLIELKDNDWVKRREEAKAKTIAEIHQEVAEEEARKSMPNLPALGKSSRAQSGSVLPRNNSFQRSTGESALPQFDKPKVNNMRRAQSEAHVSSLQRAASGQPTLLKHSSNKPAAPTTTVTSTRPSSSSVAQGSPLAKTVISEYSSPEECGTKAKSILKEYFRGGDTKEAVSTIEELVGAGNEGDVERGTSVINASVSLVLECVENDAQKLLQVLTPCLQKESIPKGSIQPGLSDSLEFLRDIEIDAPKAGSIFAIIVADWIKNDILQLDFLLKAPEMFLTEGRPASFAAAVLKKRGGEVSDSDVDVVDKLLKQEGNNENHENKSAKEWLDSAMKA